MLNRHILCISGPNYIKRRAFDAEPISELQASALNTARAAFHSSVSKLNESKSPTNFKKVTRENVDVFQRVRRIAIKSKMKSYIWLQNLSYNSRNISIKTPKFLIWFWYLGRQSFRQDCIRSTTIAWWKSQEVISVRSFQNISWVITYNSAKLDRNNTKHTNKLGSVYDCTIYRLQLF